VFPEKPSVFPPALILHLPGSPRRRQSSPQCSGKRTGRNGNPAAMPVHPEPRKHPSNQENFSEKAGAFTDDSDY